VEVVHDEPGGIAGVISMHRRHGGSRRVELEVGDRGDRIEIELPPDFSPSLRSRVAVLPRRWRLYA
jgi:sulfate transport system ATP-binding protein